MFSDKYASVVELVDTPASGAGFPKGKCEFKSRPMHQGTVNFNVNPISVKYVNSLFSLIFQALEGGLYTLHSFSKIPPVPKRRILIYIDIFPRKATYFCFVLG